MITGRPWKATQLAMAQLVSLPDPNPGWAILAGALLGQVVEQPLGLQAWLGLGTSPLGLHHGMGWLLHGLGAFHGLGALVGFLLHGLGPIAGLVEVLVGLGNLHGLGLHGLRHLHGAWHGSTTMVKSCSSWVQSLES